MPFSPGEPEPPVVPPDEAREAAREILARPEYREPEPSLVERVIDAVLGFLGDAIAGLTGSGPGSVVAVIVVAVLLLVALWVLVQASRARSGRATSTGPPPLRQGTDGPGDPATWLAEADRLAARGDHRRALRCRYQAMIARLLRDGVVDDLPGRTPAELGRELSARRPGLAGRLEAVTTGFEATWYGGGEVSAATFARFADDVEAIEAHVAGSDRDRPRGVPA